MSFLRQNGQDQSKLPKFRGLSPFMEYRLVLRSAGKFSWIYTTALKHSGPHPWSLGVVTGHEPIRSRPG